MTKRISALAMLTLAACNRGNVTTGPADAVRDEYVITTPSSEVSEQTTVDRTAPKIKLRCPKKVKVGSKAFVRIKASDEGVGLARDPSGRKKIRTGRKGKRRIKVKATDRLGNKAVKGCRVKVVRR